MRTARGVHWVSDVAAGFALLYPPYSCMADFARGTSWGVQRGEAPLRFFLSPKTGGQGG